MNTYKQCVILTIFWANSIFAHAVPDSDYEDFTKCGKDNYPLFVNGIEDLVKTSDPLSVDSITENVHDFKYQLKNAKLTGMKNCIVTSLMINKKKLTFQYNLECPHLEENAKYNGEGNNIKLTCDDCLILLGGTYDKNILKDGLSHINVVRYQAVVKTKGNVNIDLPDIDGNKEKSNKVREHIKENWPSTGLNVFLDMFIKNLNSFLQLVSIEKGCAGK